MERLFDFVDVDQVAQEEAHRHLDRLVVNHRRAQQSGIGLDSGRPRHRRCQHTQQGRGHYPR